MFWLWLAQDPLPSTDALEGDANLIWFIAFLIALLTITNGYWSAREWRRSNLAHEERARLAQEAIDERKEWEKKRDAFDEWKEKAHQKTLKLALRVQKALEVWHGIEENNLIDNGE